MDADVPQREDVGGLTQEARIEPCMRTIYTDKNIPRSLVVKALKRVWPGVVYSGLSPSRFEILPDPVLPGPRWVRVKNRLCGICGSDLSILNIDADPSIAPVALPGIDRLYLGHECVSEVIEIGPGVTRFEVGDRVIMDTRFQGANCISQELETLCSQCERGVYTLCENSSCKHGPAGVGGGWGDGYTCHESEIYPVPDALNDEQAMMVEPISVGMRAALLRTPAEGEHCLILGFGIVGINTLQCVRAISPKARITVVARYDHQAEVAKRLGADEVIRREDLFDAAARITGARLYEGLLGNRMLLGGYQVIFDCVGSAKTVNECLRMARGGGTVVLVGIKFAPLKVDLTPVWFQEVDLIGLYAHGPEQFRGERKSTFDVVIKLMEEGSLTTEGLVTHQYSLSDWRTAVATAQDKRTGSIKVAFKY